MTMRKLGRTGLEVLPLCLGGNVFGWTCDEAESFAVLDAYVEGGGNFIDTAEAYSRWVPGNPGGVSEAIIGKWMASRKNRHQLVIGTKVGAPMGDTPELQGLSRRRILDAVDGSLKRLQTDVLDLYQAHFDDAHTPLEETMATFDELVKAGKVRHIGASNYTAARLQVSFDVAERAHLRAFETMQPEYNLMDRERYEGPLQALCVSRGLGVIPYYSLASGFLTGKYRKGQPLPDTDRAGKVQESYMNNRGWRVIEALAAVAEQHDATMAQVALAWLMAKPGVTAAIASATTPAQTRDLLAATRLTLDPGAMRRLDEAGQTTAGKA